MLLLIEHNPPKISWIESYGCQFAHDRGDLLVYFVWLVNIWYLCQPRACKHIICLQALQSLLINLQTYSSLKNTCSWTYHMFVSQLVNPPWHPYKSAPHQASNLQFPLQAHWHIGMMEWHLCVVPKLAGEGRCISPLPSFFQGVGFGDFCWWVCLPDQRRVSLIYFPINFDSIASWLLPLFGPPPGRCSHQPSQVLWVQGAEQLQGLHEHAHHRQQPTAFLA